MSRVQIRPQFLLGMGAVLGALICLGILYAGTTAEAEPISEAPLDSARLRRTIASLDGEIQAEIESKFPSVAVAEANADALFPLAQEHGVRIENWLNGAPQSEKLGKTDLSKLVTSLEIRGTQPDIIGMLLDLENAFGEGIIISNVNVNGTPEDWVIQFDLTQYIKPG